MKHMIIYTDGACRKNPGPGGWAAITIQGAEETILTGSELHTTNNRMEMMAVIKGLESISEPSNIELFTDSKYVMDGCKSWIHNWKRNNWISSTGDAVKNKDLWLELDRLIHTHNVTFKWVRGHSGDPLNERADRLANKAIDQLLGKDSKRRQHKTLVVVSCAALVNSQNQVLYTQRPEGKAMAGLWEFPGGKLEPGETAEKALKRELFEEIGINVNVGDLIPLTFASQEYDGFIMVMPLYICHQWSGQVTPKENQNYAWVNVDHLKDYPMPPADEPLLDHIIRHLKNRLV